MSLLCSLTVKTLQNFNDGLFSLINIKILVIVQQIAAKFHIDPTGLTNIEEILRSITIFSKKEHLTC